jgi:hypothetical protein
MRLKLTIRLHVLQRLKMHIPAFSIHFVTRRLIKHWAALPLHFIILACIHINTHLYSITYEGGIKRRPTTYP